MKGLIVHFEDGGQDFLTWQLDRNGKVVDCTPFQASVWCGYYVLNFPNIKAGDTLSILKSPGDKVLNIKYPVLSVKEL